MLTVDQIINKTYTPRDLWDVLMRVQKLEAAIQKHKWLCEWDPSEADKQLWEILEEVLE